MVVQVQQECNLPVSETSLLTLGILTEDKIRKHPLKYTNLQVVLKVYAVSTYQPFRFYIYGHKNESTQYYLTDYGLTWLYDFFKDKSLEYARSLFGNLFVRATEDTLSHLDTYPYFNNFRGTIGAKTKQGSKQPALIIRKVNKTERRYEFDSIADARAQLNVWLTLYPIDQFSLYRIRTDKKGYKFKDKLNVTVERNIRNVGIHPNDWGKQ